MPVGFGYPSKPESQKHRGIGSNPMPHFYSSQQHPDDPIIPLNISFFLTLNQGTGDLTRVDVLSMSVP
jgi:hypothetical protein